MSRKRKYIPEESDWRGEDGHEAPSRKFKHKKCNIIQHCPECGKPGCLTYWLEMQSDGINLTGYKVLVCLHAHFLYPSFEQRRNWSHIIKGDEYRVRFKPSEIRRSVKLINANELPWFVINKFNVS